MNLWLETNILAHDFIESSYWESKFDSVKKMMPNAIVFIYEEKGIVKGFISDCRCSCKGELRELQEEQMLEE